MLDIRKIKSVLAGSSFISEIYYFPEINSTSLYAKSLNTERDILVLTDYQTQGVGRFDRTWESGKGKNLTFTIKKRFNIDSENIQSVNFFFSYFLYAFLKDFIAKNMLPGNIFPEVTIKWPNDIMVNAKKISGLLMENNFSKKEFIIGVGININQKKFSQEHSQKPASLINFVSQEVPLSGLLVDLINTYDKNVYLLEDRHYGLIFKLWKNSTALIDKEVAFLEYNKGIKYGKVIDLLYDGGVKIEQNGEVFTFYSGDVKLQIEAPNRT